jgi:PAS domain S-box-containing protein
MGRSASEASASATVAASGAALLLDASTGLLTSSAPRELLPDLYARLASLTGLEVVGHFEDGPSRFAIGQGLTNDERAAIGSVIATCRMSAELATVNGSAAPALNLALRSAGLKQYVCHPLVEEGRRVGTLLFATRERHALQRDALDLVHRLGELVGAALARSRSVRALEATATRYRRFVDSIDDGVCTIEMIYDADDNPRDYRFLEVNPAFERHTGFHDAVGRTARELVPEIDDAWFRLHDEVARTGKPRRFEFQLGALKRWLDIYAMRIDAPEARRVGHVVRDVSERKRRERNLIFLAGINADFAELSDPQEIMQTAGRKIGEHLEVSRLAFAAVDEAAQTVRVFHEWRLDEQAHPSLGTYHSADFVEQELFDTMKRGQPVAIADLRTDPRTAVQARRYEVWDTRALLEAPHRSGGRLRFLLITGKSTPYAWRRDEVELVDELSTRLWLRLERAWAEETLKAVSDTAPVVLWMSDESGALTFVNRTWRDLTGQTEAEALGFGWLGAVHHDDHERVCRTLEEASVGRNPFVLDYRLRSADGSHRWVVEAGMPRRDHEGQWAGYVGSILDVHDRKVAEERLREADRRKDQFLAVLSHELRNPLAPIATGLHILEVVDPTSHAAKRARTIIKRQVDQLVRLVDDLLDVTRVSRGKIEVRRDRLELGQLVREAVDDHRGLFEDHGVSLHGSFPERTIFVVGDANRLKQAVGNLLQNAAKFTSRGQAASIEVRQHDDQAIVRVADTGLGMEPRTIAILFEPFMQADDTLARSSGGLGLGLALVRGIVELHGGTVSARSDGLGRGSVFELHLPLASGDGQPKSIRAPVEMPRSLSILIIEDAADVAETMRMLLELEGHTVTIARDGSEGLDAARAIRPDVVLCDLGLPGLDGYAVARALTSDPDLASIHRVAISGYALPEDFERSRAAGFHHHLAKPASIEALRKILASLNARHQSDASPG